MHVCSGQTFRVLGVTRLVANQRIHGHIALVANNILSNTHVAAYSWFRASVLMSAVKGEGLASAAQLLLGGAGSAVGTYLSFAVQCLGLMRFVV